MRCGSCTLVRSWATRNWRLSLCRIGWPGQAGSGWMAGQRKKHGRFCQKRTKYSRQRFRRRKLNGQRCLDLPSNDREGCPNGLHLISSPVYFVSISRARELSFSDDFHGVAMPGRAIIRFRVSENGSAGMGNKKPPAELPAVDTQNKNPAIIAGLVSIVRFVYVVKTLKYYL
jgi:hypothetical protein